jgi:hypothetical protein
MKKHTLTFILLLSLLGVKIKLNSQCFYNNNTIGTNSKLQSSGNAKLDLFLTNNLKKLAYPWAYNIDFGFSKGFNGQAIPYNFGEFDGKIILGKELMVFEFSKQGLAYQLPMGNYFAYAVLAHEFAHIIQFNHKELLFQDVVTQEIHADIIAGYFLARFIHKNSGHQSKLSVLYSSDCSKIKTNLLINFGNLGDNAFWSSNHHGNYSTRSLAINEGMDIYFNKVGDGMILRDGQLIHDPNWDEMTEFEFWLLQRPSNGFSYGIETAKRLIQLYDN